MSDAPASALTGLRLLAQITAGSVTPGGSERILSLLTTGTDGFVQHCALSRNEVEVDGAQLHVAIRARRTAENLERTSKATLVVVDGESIVSYRLVVRDSVRQDGVLGLRLEVETFEADTLGVPLSGPCFVATADLADVDRWSATRAALVAIRDRR